MERLLTGGLGFRGKEKEWVVTGGLGPSGLRHTPFFILFTGKAQVKVLTTAG